MTDKGILLVSKFLPVIISNSVNRLSFQEIISTMPHFVKGDVLIDLQEPSIISCK